MAITRPQGFTLIELVAVIVVVAVLAAISIPRFLDIGRDARIAKLNGALGSIRSVIEIARLRQQIDNGGPNASIVMGGATITMRNGYPDATLTGIPVAAGIASPDYVITKAALPPPLLHILVPGAPDEGNCRIRYQQAAALGASPVITTVTTGC